MFLWNTANKLSKLQISVSVGRAQKKDKLLKDMNNMTSFVEYKML